jgi:hypothetical protein
VLLLLLLLLLLDIPIYIYIYGVYNIILIRWVCGKSFFGKSLPIVYRHYCCRYCYYYCYYLLVIIHLYFTTIYTCRRHRDTCNMQFPLCDYVRRVFLFHFARPRLSNSIKKTLVLPPYHSQITCLLILLLEFVSFEYRYYIIIIYNLYYRSIYIHY